MNYRQAIGLSGSQLGLLAECPVKFRYLQDNPKEATDAMVFGTLCHEALLEPNTISGRYSVMLEAVNYKRNTNEGKVNYAALEGRGLPLISESDLREAQAMASVARLNPIVRQLLSLSPLIEHEMYWDELEVSCKGKVDLYCPKLNVLVDVKTSNDISPDKFYWKAYDYGYLLQMCHYQSGLKQTLGLDSYPGLMIIAMETEAPYVVEVYTIDQEDIDKAHTKRRELLENYKGYMSSGIWPGYTKEGVHNLCRKR
jgi:hypothetical protein